MTNNKTVPRFFLGSFSSVDVKTIYKRFISQSTLQPELSTFPSPELPFETTHKPPRFCFHEKKSGSKNLVKIWLFFSSPRQMQSAMLSWANSAGIQSFMDSPGCLAYQDSWVGFYPPKPPNPNQPTKQLVEKCHKPGGDYWNPGWVGVLGELVFATWDLLGRKFWCTLEATIKKKRRQEVGYFYGENNPPRKTRKLISHLKVGRSSENCRLKSAVVGKNNDDN